MVNIGHVIINDAGELVGIDEAFCAMMHTSLSAIAGTPVLDVTAPADRAECEAAIRRLRATGNPFVITKRFLRGDGSLLWVRNSVSMAGRADGSSVMVATVEPILEPTSERGPATLLDAARFLIRSRGDRGDICDTALFSDPGWDAILSCYVAEAEGRPMTATGLAETIGHTPSVIARWIAALIQHDVLEVETRRPSADSEKAFRLTSATHRKLEAYLDRLAYPR